MCYENKFAVTFKISQTKWENAKKERNALGKTERHAVVSRLHPDSVEKKKKLPLVSFFPKEGFLAQPVIGLTFNILCCPF